MYDYLDNKYTRWYWAIINRRRAIPYDGYIENHHIVPESFYKRRTRNGPAGWLDGNPDTPTNRIDLSGREHALCHWLLTKMTEGTALIKCRQAFEMMGVETLSQGRKMTRMVTRAYERNRIEVAKIRSDRMKVNNVARLPGVGDKIAAKKRGVKRESFSKEWLDNLKKSNSGTGNGMYGKSHSESTRHLISERARQRRYSQDTNNKRKDASSGRREITDGIIYKKVKTDELQSWLDRGWVIQGKPRKKKQPT